MAALNLFPARVRFVNNDGTLTNEAYRALQIVFGRVGGALGDTGMDVFGQVFGAPTDSANNLSNALSDVVQPVNFGTDYYGDVTQFQTVDMSFADVIQPFTNSIGEFTSIAISGNATIGGTLKLAAGTVGLPSLYWSTDTTTGFYRIGANNNGYAVSGVRVLSFLSTGLTIGTSASTFAATVNGINSGTAGGASVLVQNAGTSIIAIGNKSSLIGGAYSATPMLYGNAQIETNTGLLVAGALTATGTLTLAGGASLLSTTASLTNGAGASAGTLGNAPAAGNPTKWIGINDNGVTRLIPTW